jgi:hypothetical protein
MMISSGITHYPVGLTAPPPKSIGAGGAVVVRAAAGRRRGRLAAAQAGGGGTPAEARNPLRASHTGKAPQWCVPFTGQFRQPLWGAWVVTRKTQPSCARSDGMPQPPHHSTPACARAPPFACNRHVPCLIQRTHARGSGWRATRNGAHHSEKGAAKFGISDARCYIALFSPFQPGAPHSRFGMYLVMMQHASLLKPASACCASWT